MPRMGIVSLAQYARKRGWLDQELAEFQRVRDALTQAGLDVATDHGLTDEGDPWFVFLRAGTDEVTAHFARIDGQFIADSSACAAPLHGRDLRDLLNKVFQQAAQHTVLIPTRSGGGPDGGNVLLHPAAMLVAFVATAFLQVQQGTREGAPIADEAQGDSGRGEDGGKTASARLAAGASPSATTPANPVGRAVTFSESGLTMDHGLSGGLMTTVLFAALGALHDLDAAAARGDGDESGGAGPVGAELSTALALATPPARGTGSEAPGGGDTVPARESGPPPDTTTPSPPETTTGTSETMISALSDAVNAAAPLPGAARSTPAPSASDPAVEVGPVAPALMAAQPGAAPGENGDDGEGSEGASETEGFLLTDIDAQDLVTVGDSDLFADSIPIIFGDVLEEIPEEIPEKVPEEAAKETAEETDAPAPSLDALMSAANQGVPDSLSSIVSFIDSARDDPATVTLDATTLIELATDMFTDSAGNRPTFVMFESDDIKATAFAFMPGVVFLDAKALDDVAVRIEAEPQEIDLDAGADITLIGVVEVSDPFPGVFFDG